MLFHLAGKKFMMAEVQIAGGVPLRFGEPEPFRIGLFGLNKLKDVDRAVANWETVLDQFSSSLSG